MFLVPWFTSCHPISKMSPKDWKNKNMMLVMGMTQSLDVLKRLSKYDDDDGDDDDDDSISMISPKDCPGKNL